MNLPVGFVFQPNNDDIFNILLPQRLIFGSKPLLDLYNGVLIEINLYQYSPEEIFIDNKPEYYFFTALESKFIGQDKKMKREIEGKGTWSCRSKSFIILNGVQVGVKRLFNFKYNAKNPRKDDGITWIMHEYVADKDYIKSFNHHLNITVNHNNNIAFCHVYKKRNPNSGNKKRALPASDYTDVCFQDSLTMDDNNGISYMNYLQSIRDEQVCDINNGVNPEEDNNQCLQVCDSNDNDFNLADYFNLDACCSTDEQMWIGDCNENYPMTMDETAEQIENNRCSTLSSVPEES